MQLDLSGNKIGGYEAPDGYDRDGDEQTKWVTDPTGAQALAHALKGNASVTECNVCGNSLDSESATLLAKV